VLEQKPDFLLQHRPNLLVGKKNRKWGEMAAILNMGFKAESAHPKGAHSRLWSPQTGRHRRPVCGL